MQPIPRPSLLDADELLLTCRDPADAAELVKRVCAYAEQLWTQLDQSRRYLLDSTAGGQAEPATAEDDDAWRRWESAYAGISSVLAGPRGDGGHAASEARQLVTTRRSR